MKTFWDTNVFIYLIEKHPLWYDRARSLLSEHLGGTGQLITSMLTLGELLSQPLRAGRRDEAERYVEFLTRTERLGLVTFDRQAAEHYAVIRATTALRQPDSMQLACAAAAGATAFITNDHRLWGLKVAGIDSISGL